MGRARGPLPRSRVALHRRILQDPTALRSWLLVLAAALLVAVVVGHAVSRADRAEQRWGRTRTVWVSTAPLGRGAPLADAVQARRYPVGLVPPGALTAVPTGAHTAHPVGAEVPLVASDVLGTGGGAGAGPGPDRRRLAVPTEAGHLPVGVGDEVDLWATVDPSMAAPGAASTHRVAVAAVVAAVSDGAAGRTVVVVAVRPAEVAAVVEATTLATLTLVAAAG